MTNSFEPGVYVKGDNTRRVDTKADAVQAVFDGYHLQADDEAPADESNDESVPDESQADEETTEVADADRPTFNF